MRVRRDSSLDTPQVANQFLHIVDLCSDILTQLPATLHLSHVVPQCTTRYDDRMFEEGPTPTLMRTPRSSH